MRNDLRVFWAHSTPAVHKRYTDCDKSREVYNGWDDVGLVAVAVVVFLLLGGLAFYPGTLALGYEDDFWEYYHEIEGGPGDNTTAGGEFESATNPEYPSYRYEELSPTAQEFFDRTRTADSATYTPNICTDYMLVCSGYYEEELPTEFTYGQSLDNASLYTIIEYNGDSYLLQTGTSSEPNNPNFQYGFNFLLFRGLLLLHAGTIAAITLVRLSGRWSGADDDVYTILIGGGVVSATAGFLLPYVQLSGLVSGEANMTLLGTAVALGYAVFALVWLAQAIARRFDLTSTNQFDSP